MRAAGIRRLVLTAVIAILVLLVLALCAASVAAQEKAESAAHQDVGASEIGPAKAGLYIGPCMGS